MAVTVSCHPPSKHLHFNVPNCSLLLRSDCYLNSLPSTYSTSLCHFMFPKPCRVIALCQAICFGFLLPVCSHCFSLNFDIPVWLRLWIVYWICRFQCLINSTCTYVQSSCLLCDISLLLARSFVRSQLPVLCRRHSHLSQYLKIRRISSSPLFHIFFFIQNHHGHQHP